MFVALDKSFNLLGFHFLPHLWSKKYSVSSKYFFHIYEYPCSYQGKQWMCSNTMYDRKIVFLDRNESFVS